MQRARAVDVGDEEALPLHETLVFAPLEALADVAHGRSYSTRFR
jgi:hypothetical protein